MILYLLKTFLRWSQTHKIFRLHIHWSFKWRIWLQTLLLPSPSFSSPRNPLTVLSCPHIWSKGTKRRYTSAPNLLVWLEGTLFWASFHVQCVFGVSKNLNPAPEGCFVFWNAQTPNSPTFFRWAWLVSLVPHLEIVFKKHSCYVKPSAGTTSASCGPLFQ